MSYTKWHFFIIVVVIVWWVSESKGETITTAITDNGCKAEAQIPAKQERRDTYNLDNI